MRRALGVAALVVAAMVLGGCSSSRDLPKGESNGQTLPTLADDGGGDTLASASAAAKRLQAVIDKLLAEDDACKILTRQDLSDLRIDPTSLASSSARKVLSQGVVDVYDHLMEIIVDPSVDPALQAQRDSFVRVLDIVERNTANPSSKVASDQIRAIVSAPAYVSAGDAVAAWTYANCSA